MRGKVPFLSKLWYNQGITPAHAGKSGGHVPKAQRATDHPRTCGEKYAYIEQGNFNEGSPPHMRGKAI